MSPRRWKTLPPGLEARTGRVLLSALGGFRSAHPPWRCFRLERCRPVHASLCTPACPRVAGRAPPRCAWAAGSGRGESRCSFPRAPCPRSPRTSRVCASRLRRTWDLLAVISSSAFPVAPCRSSSHTSGSCPSVATRGSSSSAAVLTSVVSVGLWVFRSFLLRGLLRFPPPDFPRRILQFSSLQVPFVPFFPIL